MTSNTGGLILVELVQGLVHDVPKEMGLPKDDKNDPTRKTIKSH